MVRFPKLFKKSISEMTQQADAVKETLKAKYLIFQKLLNKNNYVLELMADMQEKLSGEYLFDRHYINTNVRLIANGVLNTIENLNTLSKDKYPQLYKVFDDINKEIEKILEYKLEIPVSDFAMDLPPSVVPIIIRVPQLPFSLQAS